MLSPEEVAKLPEGITILDSRFVNTDKAKLQRMPISSSASASQSNDVRVRDFSHILIRESMPLTGGGHVDVEFYHPVMLVQEVFDRCDNLMKIYMKKFEDNPATAEKPWKIQFGCTNWLSLVYFG